MLHGNIRNTFWNSKEKEDLKGLACPLMFPNPHHLRDNCVYSALFHAKNFLATQSVSKGNTNLFFSKNTVFCLTISSYLQSSEEMDRMRGSVTLPLGHNKPLGNMAKHSF